MRKKQLGRQSKVDVGLEHDSVDKRKSDRLSAIRLADDGGQAQDHDTLEHISVGVCSRDVCIGLIRFWSSMSVSGGGHLDSRCWNFESEQLLARWLAPSCSIQHEYDMVSRAFDCFLVYMYVW